MRIALISDIHGNLVALDAVLADIAQRDVDRIICLGDIVDLGPEPGATIDRLRERGIASIQGNHDPLDEYPSMPALAEIEAWTRAQVSAEQLRWLQSLPAQLSVDLGGAQMLCVHGSPLSFNDQLLAETPQATLDQWLADVSAEIIVAGHTHVQLQRRTASHLIINVGSVGMPFVRAFAGQPPRVMRYADYGIVSCTHGVIGAELIRLPLDFAELTRRHHAVDFPDVATWLQQWV